MSTPTPPLPSVGDRFDNLLIAVERVNKMLGKRAPGEVQYVESEQSDARRQLLHVEKVAIKNKVQQAQSQADFIDSISHELHAGVVNAIVKQMENSGDVYTRVLGLNDAATELLDVLATRAASISKLEPLAAAMPWLYDEIIPIVNAPQFRRRDSRGRIIVVESLRTAMSFMGIENLRLLLPTLIFKRTLPQITDPFPQIKHKMWQYAHGTAVSAREFARFYSAKTTPAFMLGMLSQIGRSALVRMYFRTFDQVQRQMLEEAQQKRERDRHDALLNIAPSANYVIALQNEFGDSLTADLFEHMVFKRLPLSQAMRSISNEDDIEEGSYAYLLKQARLYTQVRMLHQHRFIEKDELRPTLDSLNFPFGSLETLKDIDIFQLPLSVETDKN